jgi:tetratricopeptide (TPR) repeat protein
VLVVGNIIKINRRKSWFRSGNNTDKKLLNKKRLVVAAIAITALIIIGIIIWWYMVSIHNHQSTQKYDESNSNKAIKSIITGDYSAGQSALDKSLDATTDPKEQAWLYIQKSSVALNLKKYNEAYDFAKKAEELNPDRTSAQMMADAAAKKGDNQEAISKYKLTISRITGTSGMDDLDKQELQDKISQLEGQE